jgi:hypothetical protein
LEEKKMRAPLESAEGFASFRITKDNLIILGKIPNVNTQQPITSLDKGPKSVYYSFACKTSIVLSREIGKELAC